MSAEMVDLSTGEILSPTATLATLDPSEIDKAADPGAFVVLCLERSKTWLTEALEQGDIGSIVEMKSQAEAIRVYTVQKQLAKDSELAATEIVRRAERCLGRAVRRAQESGNVAPPSRTVGRRAAEEFGNRDEIPKPIDFFGSHTERTDAYALAESSDSEFEAALTSAKAEGNLSRANVKRKVSGGDLPPPTKRPEHLAKTRHHDSNRIVEQTVLGLEGYALGIGLIEIDQLDRSQVAGWSRSLSASLQSLNRLSRQLKELDQHV